MLPSAQKYLQSGGLDPSPAAYITIGCFLGGVIGIQSVSRILHHYIPSHVVDCDHDHDHDEEEAEDNDDYDNHEEHQHLNGHHQKQNGDLSEHTPLLAQSEATLRPSAGSRTRSAMVEGADVLDPYTTAPPTRAPTLQTRPTMQTRLTHRMSTFVLGAKAYCDEGGPCYGYGDPCGHHCLKTIGRNPTRAFGRFSYAVPPRQPSLLRTATTFNGRPKRGLSCLSSSADEESDHLAPPSTFQERPTVAPAASTQAIFRGRRSSSNLNRTVLTE